MIVCCHYPLFEEATRASHVLENADSLLRVMQKYDGVVRCVFAGHDHLGGYAIGKGFAGAHVTIPAVLESAPGPDGNAFAFVRCGADGSVEIEGFGSVGSLSVAASPIAASGERREQSKG